MNLLVSVVIPAYNLAPFLTEAVRSVFAQTYSAIECIVVDDGSTDNTREVLQALVRSYPSLKTACQTNGGVSSARNLGLCMCSGDLVAFLDADDVFLPDKIERQVKFLQEHPNIGMVYGDYLLVEEDLQPLAFFNAQMPRSMQPLDALACHNWFNPLVILIRRNVIEQVGMFDEELAVAEDWDYWIRCARLVPLAYLQGAVALYRQHACQVHRNHARMRESCIRVIRKHFLDDHTRLRSAMAAIDLNDAKHFWRTGDVSSSFASLIRYAFKDGLGLRAGSTWRQVKAIAWSQLRPLSSGLDASCSCRN
jgi:glycosyltransferase involved in cell wall biosynthesis